MKNAIFFLLVAGAFSTPSFAGEGHDHMKGSTHEGHSMGSKNMHANHGTKDGKAVTLSGELIGLTCFVKHGSKGKSHKACAKSCAEKGLPIGLLSGGTIYQVSGKGHSSLKEAYKPLLKYVEEKVTIKGTLFEKNGLKVIVIQKIKAS